MKSSRFKVCCWLENSWLQMDIENVLSFKMDVENDIKKSYLNKCKRQKRYRCAFTFDQVKYLENEFKKSRYVGVVNRKEISKALNISERAIKIWFQNRRMREKKDLCKEFQHYDSGINDFFDIKIMRTNSTLEHETSRTQLIDNQFNNNEQITNRLLENQEIGTSNRDDTISSTRVLNDDISNLNGTNITGKISNESLKKYKNSLPVESTVKSSKSNDTRQKEAEVGVYTSSVPLVTSTVTSHQPSKTCTQNRTGYVPILSQSHYQPCLAAGSIILKAVDPAEIATIMPVRDVDVTRPQSIPYPVTNYHSMQKNKCLCNCHNMNVSHQANKDNQTSQAQYVLVPLHKNSLEYATQIFKEC